MNKCSSCSRDFTSVSAFDKHRTGSFKDGSRRCMTEQEMTRAGLERKARGKWGKVASDDLQAMILRRNDQALKVDV